MAEGWKNKRIKLHAVYLTFISDSRTQVGYMNENGNQERLEVDILILGKIDFIKNCYKRQKGHYIYKKCQLFKKI